MQDESLPSVGDARNIARQSMTKARSGINPVEERREQQAVVKTEAAPTQSGHAVLV